MFSYLISSFFISENKLEGKKMKNITILVKKRKALICISLIATFIMFFTISLIPSTLAQIGYTMPRETSGFISVAPEVIGVGQQALVTLWVTPLPTNYAGYTYYGVPRGQSFEGITVTFIKPDGTTDTFMPRDANEHYNAGEADGGSSLFFYYTPEMEGEWSVTMTVPAQNFTDWSGTVEWEASTSEPFSFTVTTEAQYAGIICGYPWAELPNEDAYWEFPISSNNREWSMIAGNWLNIVHTFSSYQPYSSAPNTGHILWKESIVPAGIVSGLTGSASHTVSTYMDATGGTTVINGKLYLNLASTFQCIDMKTGDVLWTQDGSVKGGLDLPGNALIQSFFGAGVVLEGSFGSMLTPYLFGTGYKTWNYYDVSTGKLLNSMTNVTASGFIFVEGTDIAFGYTSGSNPKIWKWSMNKVTNNDWYTGIEWIESYNALGSFQVSADLSTIVFCNSRGGNTANGYSTEDGHSLWNLTLPYQAANGNPVALTGTNYFYVLDDTTDATVTIHVYSMHTGELYWETPVGTTNPWNTRNTGVVNTDTTNVYFAGPDGIVTAIDLATGDILWKSTPIPSTEHPNNVVPFWGSITIVGGMLYVYGGGTISYEINPIPRFSILHCIDASTGEAVFTLNGGINPTAAVGGCLFGLSRYDGTYYCIGKGETSTSVAIQDDVVTNQETVLIKGTVLDESPAQAGTPAVSDSSMSEWMDYLHMQNSTLLNNPPTPEGVEVQLTAIDPNNNLITIGTTTTQASGNFYFEWNVPSEITGIYKITATFAGSDSYWPSDSETAVIVTQAPSPATPIDIEEPAETTEPTTEQSTPLISTEVVIIAAISVIVSVAAFFVLRKRK